jgi:DNA-binding MarR family transcriptional regulator
VSHGGSGPAPEYLCLRAILCGVSATPDQLLEALSAVRRAVRRRAERPVELSVLTGAQLELVRLLRREPGVSIADAAARLRVAPNTVSTLVGQLTDAGVVERRVDDADRRVVRLTLTPGVRRRVDAWRDRRVDELGDALARLSAADRACLDDAVPALIRLADELHGEGGGR